MKRIWASYLTKNILMIMGVLIPVSDSKFLVTGKTTFAMTTPTPTPELITGIALP